MVEGESVSQFIANVKVQIRGEDAEKVYALGEIAADPIEIDGKKIAAKPPTLGIKGFDFECLNRWGSTSSHPKDGIEFELKFWGIPKNAKLIDTVRGTVQVLAGGSEHVVSIDDLLTREPGPIKSSVLKTAKLKVNFDRFVTKFNDEEVISVGIKMDMAEKNAFAGLQLVGADGKVSDETPLRVQGENTYKSYYQIYQIDKIDLGKASLRILVRDGGEVKSMPFEVHNVNIE